MKNFIFMGVYLLLIPLAVTMTSCGGDWPEQQKSDSGATKQTVKVQLDANGQTVEQYNVSEKLRRDNALGEIKHLYVVSSFTGDIMEYSTVRGKVTSGNKRLSPSTVDGHNSMPSNCVYIDGKSFITDEVLDDSGTYGSSANYIFWFDAQGVYHQYFPSGGTYLHISDRPLKIKKLNYSLSGE